MVKKISKEMNDCVLKRFNLQESRGGVSYFKEGCGVFSKNNILREVWLIMSDYIFSRGGM